MVEKGNLTPQWLLTEHLHMLNYFHQRRLAPFPVDLLLDLPYTKAIQECCRLSTYLDLSELIEQRGYNINPPELYKYITASDEAAFGLLFNELCPRKLEKDYVYLEDFHRSFFRNYFLRGPVKRKRVGGLPLSLGRWSFSVDLSEFVESTQYWPDWEIGWEHINTYHLHAIVVPRRRKKVAENPLDNLH